MRSDGTRSIRVLNGGGALGLGYRHAVAAYVVVWRIGSEKKKPGGDRSVRRVARTRTGAYVSRQISHLSVFRAAKGEGGKTKITKFHFGW